VDTDDKLIATLLPGRFAAPVPVGAFHSVGEYICERTCDFGITGVGGGLGGRRAHICKGDGGVKEEYKEAQKRILYATMFQFFHPHNLISYLLEI